MNLQLKLKDNHLQRLQQTGSGGGSGSGSEGESSEMADLRAHVEELQKQVAHHPDVVKLKLELDNSTGEREAGWVGRQAGRQAGWRRGVQAGWYGMGWKRRAG